MFKSNPFFHNAKSAQSLTELALTLPMLLIIMLGALDLGRVFYSQVAITNAAREGARYGTLHYADESGIKAYAKRESANAGTILADSDIIIRCSKFSDDTTLNCSSAGNGDRLQVTVTTNFQFLTLYLFRLPSIKLVTSATMAITNAS